MKTPASKAARGFASRMSKSLFMAAFTLATVSHEQYTGEEQAPCLL